MSNFEIWMVAIFVVLFLSVFAVMAYAFIKKEVPEKKTNGRHHHVMKSHG